MVVLKGFLIFSTRYTSSRSSRLDIPQTFLFLNDINSNTVIEKLDGSHLPFLRRAVTQCVLIIVHQGEHSRLWMLSEDMTEVTALTCSCQLSPVGSILCCRVAPFSPTATRNSCSTGHTKTKLIHRIPSWSIATSNSHLSWQSNQQEHLTV